MANLPASSKFSQRQRQLQIQDDMTAGYSIPAILTAIVVFGLVAMVLSVGLAI